MEQGFEFYKQQEALLESQLEAVRAYMKAFFPNQFRTKKQSNEIQSPSVQISSMVDSLTDATQTLIDSVKRVTIPDKVFSSLEAIEQGKTKDVANKMAQTYPEYSQSPSKALTDARYYISKLKSEGRIEIVSEGNGNEGSIYKVAK